MGTPLERMFLMAEAMLEAMKQFKSPDGKSLRIRVGALLCKCMCVFLFYLPCFLSRVTAHVAGRISTSVLTNMKVQQLIPEYQWNVCHVLDQKQAGTALHRACTISPVA